MQALGLRLEDPDEFRKSRTPLLLPPEPWVETLSATASRPDDASSATTSI
jgi:hypothetical protein